MPRKENNANTACEVVLYMHLAYCIDRDIFPQQNVVANRILERSVELTDAYAEIHKKLGRRPQALSVFFDCLLSTAAYWNPERNKEARAARDRLEYLNRAIAHQAADLAELLSERSNLSNSSGFHTETHYHPCDVIAEASRENYLYNSWVKERLSALCSQFDLKYWPSLSQCLWEISRDAERSEIRAGDPLTEAATRSSRPSRADFVKAFFAAIESNSVREHGFLPDDLRLTDATLASLVNCALDVDADEMVDAAYIKHLRQRERSQTA